MADFIKIKDDQLIHFGVKGMHWGQRAGRGITTSRQIAFDKKALTKLDNGGHTSRGITKKRHAAYDERDKKALEKRIEKNTLKLKKMKDQPAPKKSYLTDEEKADLDKIATNIRISMLQKQGRNDAARELRARQITKELFGGNDATAARLRSKMLEKRGQTDAAREVRTQSILDEIFGN